MAAAHSDGNASSSGSDSGLSDIEDGGGEYLFDYDSDGSADFDRFDTEWKFGNFCQTKERTFINEHRAGPTWVAPVDIESSARAIDFFGMLWTE